MLMGPFLFLFPMKPLALKKETLFKKLVKGAQKEEVRWFAIFVFLVLTMAQGGTVYSLWHGLYDLMGFDLRVSLGVTIAYSLVCVFYLVVFFTVLMKKPLVVRGVDILHALRRKLVVTVRDTEVVVLDHRLYVYLYLFLFAVATGACGYLTFRVFAAEISGFWRHTTTEQAVIAIFMCFDVLVFVAMVLYVLNVAFHPVLAHEVVTDDGRVVSVNFVQFIGLGRLSTRTMLAGWFGEHVRHKDLIRAEVERELRAGPAAPGSVPTRPILDGPDGGSALHRINDDRLAYLLVTGRAYDASIAQLLLGVVKDEAEERVSGPGLDDFGAGSLSSAMEPFLSATGARFSEPKSFPALRKEAEARTKRDTRWRSELTELARGAVAFLEAAVAEASTLGPSRKEDFAALETFEDKTEILSSDVAKFKGEKKTADQKKPLLEDQEAALAEIELELNQILDLGGEIGARLEEQAMMEEEQLEEEEEDGEEEKKEEKKVMGGKAGAPLPAPSPAAKPASAPKPAPAPKPASAPKPAKDQALDIEMDDLSVQSAKISQPAPAPAAAPSASAAERPPSRLSSITAGPSQLQPSPSAPPPPPAPSSSSLSLAPPPPPSAPGGPPPPPPMQPSRRRADERMEEKEKREELVDKRKKKKEVLKLVEEEKEEELDDEGYETDLEIKPVEPGLPEVLPVPLTETVCPPVRLLLAAPHLVSEWRGATGSVPIGLFVHRVLPIATVSFEGPPGLRVRVGVCGRPLALALAAGPVAEPKWPSRAPFAYFSSENKVECTPDGWKSRLLEWPDPEPLPAASATAPVKCTVSVALELETSVLHCAWDEGNAYRGPVAVVDPAAVRELYFFVAFAGGQGQEPIKASMTFSDSPLGLYLACGRALWSPGLVMTPFTRSGAVTAKARDALAAVMRSLPQVKPLAQAAPDQTLYHWALSAASRVVIELMACEGGATAPLPPSVWFLLRSQISVAQAHLEATAGAHPNLQKSSRLAAEALDAFCLPTASAAVHHLQNILHKASTQLTPTHWLVQALVSLITAIKQL
jgi:hypothetical protein